MQMLTNCNTNSASRFDVMFGGRIYQLESNLTTKLLRKTSFSLKMLPLMLTALHLKILCYIVIVLNGQMPRRNPFISYNKWPTQPKLDHNISTSDVSLISHYNV